MESRRNEAKRLNLCYNCLSMKHTMQSCTSRMIVSLDQRNITYCFILYEKSSASVESTNFSKNVSADASKINLTVHVNESPVTTSVSMKAMSDNCSSVILSIAMIYIRDDFPKDTRFVRQWVTSEFHYKRYVRTIRTHGKSNETYYFMFERD